MKKDKKIEVAESKFITDLVNRMLALERENKILKDDNRKLLHHVAELSGNRRITVHDIPDGTVMPEFDITENLAGELIYSVRNKEQEEQAELERMLTNHSRNIRLHRCRCTGRLLSRLGFDMKRDIKKVTVWNGDRTKSKVLYIDRNAKKRQDRELMWDNIFSTLFTVGVCIAFVVLYYVAFKY